MDSRHVRIALGRATPLDSGRESGGYDALEFWCVNCTLGCVVVQSSTPSLVRCTREGRGGLAGRVAAVVTAAPLPMSRPTHHTSTPGFGETRGVATCPNCAKELPGDLPFCPFCTAPLGEAAETLVREERVELTAYLPLSGRWHLGF
jgi:hypothetical protein